MSEHPPLHAIDIADYIHKLSLHSRHWTQSEALAHALYNLDLPRSLDALLWHCLLGGGCLSPHPSPEWVAAHDHTQVMSALMAIFWACECTHNGTRYEPPEAGHKDHYRPAIATAEKMLLLQASHGIVILGENADNADKDKRDALLREMRDVVPELGGNAATAELLQNLRICVMTGQCYGPAMTAIACAMAPMLSYIEEAIALAESYRRNPDGVPDDEPDKSDQSDG